MARVVPDVLPANATAGENRLIELLEKLPDDVVVYYEAKVRNRHPDIIVIDPKAGILVLEVKGWFAGNIKSANPDECVIEYYKKPKTVLHPLKQAREYLFRLVEEMKLHPQTRRFWTQGQAKIPYVWMAVMTSTNRRLLRKNFGPAVDEIFPSDRVLTQDELTEMEGLSPEGLRDFLRQRFDPWWEFEPLANRDMDSIRAWLHPEVVLSTESEQPLRIQENFSGAWGKGELPPLKILDLQQESHACRIGDGHRILSGVAGSGKTSILIARAKLVYDHIPDARILFLCYNRFLAEYLRSVLGRRKIEVWNFHKWGSSLGVGWFEGKSDERWTNDVLEKVRLLSVEERYDFVFVDEAQDFDAEWLLAARLALKDPEEGDLLLAGDGCQNLYRKKFTWNSVGIKASGRVIGEKFNLHRNYRNSREIVTLAQEVMIEFLKRNASENSGIASIVGNPAISPRETQFPPLLWKCPTREAECEGALGLVTMLLKGEWPESQTSTPLQPEEIAILYPKQVNQELIQSLMATLDREQIPNSWLSQPRKGMSYSSNHSPKSGVKIQTIHSSKGLQYRAVILIWADSLSMMNMDNEGEAQLLYVACTRAEDYLGILYSKDTPMLNRLKSSAVFLES